MKRNYKLFLVAFVAVALIATISFFNFRKNNEMSDELSPESSQTTIEKMDEIPDNFPKDFPVYPGTELMESFVSKNDETEALSVIWSTPDSVDQVAKYYDDELTKEEWNVDSVSNDDSAIIFSFNKGEFSGFAVIDIFEGGLTVVSVSMGTGSISPSI